MSQSCISVLCSFVRLRKLNTIQNFSPQIDNYLVCLTTEFAVLHSVSRFNVPCSRNVVLVSHYKNIVYIPTREEAFWPMPDWCITGTAWPTDLQRLLRVSETAMISIVLDSNPFLFSHACHFKVSYYSFKNQLLEITCMSSLFRSGPPADFMDVQIIHLTVVA